MTWWWVLVLAVPHGLADRCAGDLVGLDRERALAFATADPARLQRVYAADSPLLVADRDTLRSYAAQGGRVVGAALQVTECRVLSASRSSRRVEVTDVLGAAAVRWDDGSIRRLPKDRPTRRVVTLTMTPDGWRISGSRSSAPR